MSAHDAPQWDTDGEMFDGRHAPLRTRAKRRPMEGHGPECRPNPEVGCVCGEAERQAARDASIASRYRRIAHPFPPANPGTPFSEAADADPKVQEARKRAFEAQERILPGKPERQAS